jgi:hypothetical protein
VKTFSIGRSPLLRTTEQVSEGWQDIEKRTGSDEWWNSWAGILHQEGISITTD